MWSAGACGANIWASLKGQKWVVHIVASFGGQTCTMKMRSMTEQERAEFHAMCPPSFWQEMGVVMLPLLGSGLVVGFIAAVILRLGFWAVGVPKAESMYYEVAGGQISGLAFAAYGLFDCARRARRSGTRRKQILADLSHGEVGEETATTVSIVRLREPEHHTELLILHMEDGRVRAVLDDSTTNIGEDGPKRSGLRLGRHVTVLHLPASGRQITQFAGETLRRPKAVVSDPRQWPDDDIWLDPTALVGLPTSPADR